MFAVQSRTESLTFQRVQLGSPGHLHPVSRGGQRDSQILGGAWGPEEAPASTAEEEVEQHRRFAFLRLCRLLEAPPHVDKHLRPAGQGYTALPVL